MLTSTLVLRGRRGACGTGLALMARLGAVVARDAAALCVAWHLATSTCTLRCRCGTLRHRPSFGVAGVALGDIHAASESISLKYDFVIRNFVTHNLSYLSLFSLTCNFIAQLCQTQLFRTQLFGTHLSHTHNFVTHNFVIHNFVRTFFLHLSLFSHMQLYRATLSYTTLSHTT